MCLIVKLWVYDVDVLSRNFMLCRRIRPPLWGYFEEGMEWVGVVLFRYFA